MKKRYKIYKLDYVFVLIVLFYLSVMIFRDYIYKDTVYTICQVTGFRFHRTSGNSVKYVFYFNNVKYNGSNNADVLYSKKFIGKYYQLEVSKIDPNYSLINLEKEIIDTIQIKKAGFTYD
ncbi:hypothetical protein JM79_2083 [Gramella sp. Hel_I_59]|uniref:hypothetical protein n=1 Tax=Gramella sp. Hel_I_59 TaxID=1249978 RepID=UPI00114D7093|nr:hypothetical protein [Gramella sp. Hel_I_59]TQI71156.1 hypothetical protein JM79_2083 [Gramella sp. Hel_I_59]